MAKRLQKGRRSPARRPFLFASGLGSSPGPHQRALVSSPSDRTTNTVLSSPARTSTNLECVITAAVDPVAGLPARHAQAGERPETSRPLSTPGHTGGRRDERHHCLRSYSCGTGSEHEPVLEQGTSGERPRTATGPFAQQRLHTAPDSCVPSSRRLMDRRPSMSSRHELCRSLLHHPVCAARKGAVVLLAPARGRPATLALREPV